MAAANTDLLKKLSRRWVGQIGGGGVADDTTATIPLASVTNLPTDTAVVAVIDRVDSNGTATPNTEETIIGVVSGSNLATSVRGVEGTAQSHAAGAVVEILVTAKGYNDIIDAFLIAHTQLGVHKSGATYAAPIFSGDANLTTSTGNIQVGAADPKRGLYVPASALFGATTNGAATGQYESSTNKINTKVLDFDAATEEYAWIALPTPDWWNLSTVTVKFHWTVASGTGDVVWGVAGLCRSDDDALDTALGTAVNITDSVLTALDQHTTSATAAVTIGGTPVKGDYLYLRPYRKAADAADTFASDARLLGITVKFTMGQYNDA